MEDLDSLKVIWHTAKTDILPTSNDMLRMIRKFRRQKLRSKWLMIVISCLLSFLVFLILCLIHFKLWTTYIGGSLMIISTMLLAVNNMLSIRRFYQLDDCSNLDFLAFIEQTRLNQIRYYKKTQVAGMMLSSVGLLLYLYELASIHIVWFIVIYSLSVAYLLIMFFIVRPRNFKKGAEKLEAIRQRLENISKQLK